MNEQLLTGSLIAYCETVLAIKREGSWKRQFKTFEQYALARWGLSKPRASLLCNFVRLRGLLKDELFGLLPETPEQVKALVRLPRVKWAEAWQFVLDDNGRPPITPQNVESTLSRFGLSGHKVLSPEAKKAIRLRRAAKVIADCEDGTQLVQEIGARGLGKNWDSAVRVTIEADQARMDQLERKA
jgi:hypothetical protein